MPSSAGGPNGRPQGTRWSQEKRAEGSVLYPVKNDAWSLRRNRDRALELRRKKIPEAGHGCLWVRPVSLLKCGAFPALGGQGEHIVDTPVLVGKIRIGFKEPFYLSLPGVIVGCRNVAVRADPEFYGGAGINTGLTGGISRSG